MKKKTGILVAAILLLLSGGGIIAAARKEPAVSNTREPADRTQEVSEELTTTKEKYEDNNEMNDEDNRIFGDFSADKILDVYFVDYTKESTVCLFPPNQETQANILERLLGLEGEECEIPDEDSICGFWIYPQDYEGFLQYRFLIVFFEGNYLYRYDTKTCYKLEVDIREQVINPYLSAITDSLLGQVEDEKLLQAIYDVLQEEESALTSLFAEQLGGLSCCFFEIYDGFSREFHLLCLGEWEGKKVPIEHYVLPLNGEGSAALDQLSSYSTVQSEDVDYDGKQDLLIYLGSNGGTGGAWNYYRVLRWDDEKGQFSFFSSFPFRASELDLAHQRILNQGRTGSLCYYAEVYTIVDGEYRLTQAISVDTSLHSDGESQEWVSTVSYYENEVLKREFTVMTSLSNVDVEAEIEEKIEKNIPEWDIGPVSFMQG